MAVTTDILQAWRSPRTVLRRHLTRGTSEPFAFSLLAAFLVLAFVALWPFLSRQSVMQPEVPMLQRLVAGGLALLASIPLWYGVAAISHLVSKLFGGQGSYYAARIALFAALLAVTPAMLFQGLVAGMIGPGRQLDLVGWIVVLAFLWIWLSMLTEAERHT